MDRDKLLELAEVESQLGGYFAEMIPSGTTTIYQGSPHWIAHERSCECYARAAALRTLAERTSHDG